MCLFKRKKYKFKHNKVIIYTKETKKEKDKSKEDFYESMEMGVFDDD